MTQALTIVESEQDIEGVLDQTFFGMSKQELVEEAVNLHRNAIDEWGCSETNAMLMAASFLHTSGVLQASN